MNTLIVALLAVLLVGVAVVIALLARRPKDDQSALLMNQNLQGLQRSMDQRLSESNKIIVTVTEKLAKLDETNRQVVNFTDQLKNLQDILKNPKQRGILGEYYLESVLKNVLPPKTYQMQYKFKNGEIVDAVVFVKDRIIPVDAKFSLENYNRILATRDETERSELEKAFKNDLKFRIDETSKYVRPTEGTTEFAFMFIPSEAIYYDLLVNQIGNVKVSAQDLIHYAFQEKKVIIVSPTTFLAYLQTVLQGLRALKIEESAIEIRKAVEQLAKHLITYQDNFSKVGNYLGSAVGAYNKASDEFRKIDKDVIKIAERGTGFEPTTLDRPHEE